MVATAGSEELHATWATKFELEPSLKDPVALNCCVCPTEIEGFEGDTVIEMSVALVTVRVAWPDCPANTAEIVVVPG